MLGNEKYVGVVCVCVRVCRCASIPRTHLHVNAVRSSLFEMRTVKSNLFQVCILQRCVFVCMGGREWFMRVCVCGLWARLGA